MEPSGPAAAAAARARASVHSRQQRQQHDAQQHRTPLRAADAPAAGSGQKRSRAQSRAPSAAAAGAAQAAAPLPHVHLRPNGKWEVRLGFRHAAGGPNNPNVGAFGSQGEAAVARSLAVAFHQHSQGAALSAAKPKLLHTLASLQNQKATLRDVRACSSWQSLREMLQHWQASGKLCRLATSLTLAKATAAPAAAARSDRPAQQIVGAKRRSRSQQVQEAQGAAAGGSAPRPVPGAAVPMQQRRHGEDAVGRRVRVWLQLDDEVEQQHDGCIVEYTPTGKHHVAYSDGTEGLVDLAMAQFRFLPPAARRATAPAVGEPGPSAAAAAAAEAPGSSLAADAVTAALPTLEITSAADVGEMLHVWWPQDRVWYLGVVTHKLLNGMLCVRYKLDDVELLVDAAESNVQWVSKARQQLHKRLQRQQEQQRKAAKEAGRAVRRAQQQRQRQQQPQQQDDANSQGLEGGRPIKAEPAEEEPPSPPAPAAQEGAAGGAGTSAAAAGAAGDLPDIFDFMMDCAELPEAAAAGFTQELACSFSSLLDMLPPAQQAAKEARLRGQLEQRKFSNAAALARTALNLALAHSERA